MRRTRVVLLALLSALAGAACGPDSSGRDGDDDDGGADGAESDAGPNGIIDAGTGQVDADVVFECPPGRLGDLGEVQGAQTLQEPLDPDDPDGAQTRFLYGGFGEDATLTLVLVDGRGAFAGGAAAPGTYPLGGDEIGLDTCGACLLLWLFTDEADFAFVPTAGSITLDAVDVALTGSGADLTFQQQSAETGEILEDGCTATATGLSFDAPLQSSVRSARVSRDRDRDRAGPRRTARGSARRTRAGPGAGLTARPPE
jgi:hypothetical protein